MIYYELIERTKAHTNNFVAFSDLKTSPRDFEAYCSLFGYGQEILEFVELHKTVSGYNGDYYLRTFFFDIDCKDNLDKAKDSAIELIKKLNKDYKINPNHLIIYFSGGKGFHIGIYDKMFGGFRPSNNLPDQTKELAIELSKGVKYIDNKIYSKNRFFRLPNSKHAETGLYKIPLYFDDLNLWSIEDILNKAKEPRKGFTSRVDYKTILINEKLESLWAIIRNRPSDKELTREYKQKEAVFKVPDQGERNDILFKQAIKLFKNSSLSFDAILEIVATINRAIQPPLEEMEVFSIVKSAEKYKEEESESNQRYKFFVDYINQWIDYISPTKRKLTLCFDRIDEDIKRKLEGKLIAVMGKGGSKKTLYAENIVVKNIYKHEARCIFSQMDMGELELVSRFIDHIGDEGKVPITESLEKLEVSEPGTARVWLEDQPVKFYSDKLIVISQSNMQAKNYDVLIEDITRRHGKVDFLIVDSLSKMGGTGGETERYSKNTKELKELTIKWGVCILLLCHVTKACEKWYRDCSRYVRGSEKILDDCDIQISMSQIFDQATISDDNPEFLNDKGIIHYYNKRGSGKTIKKVFDFDTIRLLIKENADNPSAYEYKVRSKEKNKFGFGV